MFRKIHGQMVNTVSFGSGNDVLVGISGSFGTWEIWQSHRSWSPSNIRFTFSAACWTLLVSIVAF